MIFRTNPSPRVVQFYAFAWIAVYALFYFFLRDLIPEKFLRDAAEIQRLVETGFDKVDLSYATPAYIFSLIPAALLHFSVGAFYCGTLYYILRHIKTTDGMVVAAIILLPMIMLGFMSPTKEIFVVIMASGILLASSMFSRKSIMVIIICCAYAGYGLAFRSYYLLILFFFMLITYMPKNRLLQVIIFVFGCMALFMLPSDAFTALQEPRDNMNFSSQWDGPFEVRTGFYNPFAPDNAFAFIGNYFYALVRLHFPIFWDITVNEWVLFANVVIYAGLVRYGLRHLKGPKRMLVQLFLAHVVVLVFFEPDLGSYFRHFSSVFLYLLPTFAQREEGSFALKSDQGSSLPV